MYKIFNNKINLENFSEFLLYGYSEKGGRIPLISLWIFPSLCRYSIACSKSRNMQAIDISSSGGPDWSCRSKGSVSFKKSICNIAFFFFYGNEYYHWWKEQAQAYIKYTGEHLCNVENYLQHKHSCVDKHMFAFTKTRAEKKITRKRKNSIYQLQLEVPLDIQKCAEDITLVK